MSLLMETAWLDALDAHAKPARARLLGVLGLPPPKVVNPAVVRVKKVEEDSEEDADVSAVVHKRPRAALAEPRDAKDMAEQEREEDIQERDAFAERLREKDNAN